MSSHPDEPHPAHAPMALHELGLVPGLKVRAKPANHPGVAYDVHFLGLLGDRGVLVEPIGVACLREGMKTGEPLRVEGFTGEHDFGFETQVVRLFDFTFRDPPMAYALLAYPAQVDARRVRRARRVRVSLPGTVARRGEARADDVVVRDLSTAGALLESREPLGEKGADLVLAIAIEVDGEHLAMTLPATACRTDQLDGVALTGVLFQDVLLPDKLALHYLVHSMS